ncbi:DoxX family protein [Fodinicola acaciae]|uniref:DoxX family protein n=1 Tax=Fodinicola acaciae TaxID=2681555 RepID=UPI0013CFC58D|nr:DoxX family protein [Fodinicola acaciae]
MTRTLLRNRLTGRASVIATGLRLATVLIMVPAALAKLADLHTAALGLARFGYPETPLLPLALAILELLAAVALLLGVLTRPAALGLAIVMVGATIANLLFWPAVAPLTIGILAGMVYLLWAGPGALAVDNYLSGKYEED